MTTDHEAAHKLAMEKYDEFRNRVCAKPRRKRFYALTIEKHVKAEKIKNIAHPFDYDRRLIQYLNPNDYYIANGKRIRRSNPRRARHLRASWPLQYKCAVMGWLQLIYGKKNVTL